jgi:hypothetical protein
MCEQVHGALPSIIEPACLFPQLQSHICYARVSFTNARKFEQVSDAAVRCGEIADMHIKLVNICANPKRNIFVNALFPAGHATPHCGLCYDCHRCYHFEFDASR